MSNSGVYLIRTEYKGVSMLKIGFSKDVLKRVKTHKTSNKLQEVIGYIKEDNYKWLEKEIHNRCKKYKYDTEFFFDKEVIVDYFLNHENFIKL
jgi:hypothetical protein